MNESVPQTVLVCRNLLNQQRFPGEVHFAKAPKNAERLNPRMPLQIVPRCCFELYHMRTELGKQHLPVSVDLQATALSLNLPRAREPQHTQQTWIPQPTAVPVCDRRGYWPRHGASFQFSPPAPSEEPLSCATGKHGHRRDWCAPLPLKVKGFSSRNLLSHLIPCTRLVYGEKKNIKRK